MIEEYFEDIEVLAIKEGSDELGSYTTYYEKLGTVKGLLQRSSSTERMIAAQKGLSDSYTFMTKPKENNGIVINTDTIVKSDMIIARINSSELPGQSESEDMKDISQWTASSYVLVEGAEVRG